MRVGDEVRPGQVEDVRVAREVDGMTGEPLAPVRFAGFENVYDSKTRFFLPLKVAARRVALAFRPQPV